VDAFAIFPTTNSRSFDIFTYHLQTKHLSQHCLPAIKSDADADVAKVDKTKDGLPAMELEIRSMRVKEIKTELDRLGISTADAFEKEELVKRLVEARGKGTAASAASSNANVSKPKSDTNRSSTSSTAGNVIVSPLYFVTVDAGRKTAGVEIQSSDKPYPTIQIEVKSSSGNGEKFPLQLLLDTACSGLVLRPEVVEKHGLPKLSTPVSMTGAGGTVGATGLTQIDKFWLETLTKKEQMKMFGPMPAAVQDIVGLPNALDGIIGLSFLNRFACVEMDFGAGKVSFYDRNYENSEIMEINESGLLGRANMDYIPTVGLYSVSVYLGDKGPVKMLVDTGKIPQVEKINRRRRACLFSQRVDVSS
jgi:Aspartyl protease